MNIVKLAKRYPLIGHRLRLMRQALKGKGYYNNVDISQRSKSARNKFSEIHAALDCLLDADQIGGAEYLDLSEELNKIFFALHLKIYVE